MFEIKYDRDGNPVKNPELEAIKNQQEQTQIDNKPEVVAAPELEDDNVDDIEDNLPEIAEEEQAPREIYKESDAAKNFREMREAKARAERERDDYMRRLAELEAREKPRQAAPVEEDEELSIGDDDLVEGKHVSKVTKQIKKLKEELKQYKTQTAEQATEARLKSEYPDFDKVVSRDNIEALHKAYPELGRTITANDDLYTKAISAYTLIKKFGIYQESPFSSEKAVVAKNIAKPRPLSSVSPQQGDSPLSRANAFANGLNDDLRKQLFKEMQDARKGY